ncbi:transglycosylase domain-containing protein [Actinomyces haliotis]|uniref:transglycosylase domain-containing protein n=1 Tax=Actinomyces haliotis TaxID=1280843 RepID=UPI00188EE77E|nr:transglycosylase domain-containing protein [Actinomyces haliotis]
MSNASSRDRSLSPAQVIAMLLVFLLLSGVGGILTAGFAAPLVGGAAAVTNASQKLFDELPSDFNVLEPSQVSVIKASDGTELAQFYAENRIVVKLADMSPNIQNAIVAVEDRRFYEHKGVDPAGIVRALVSNANSGETQGASTLTQQYVRNVLVESALQKGDKAGIAAAKEPTVSRKLREIKYALTLEQKYSKQQILEGYLNIAAFGPSTYGVEASAQHYFSKSAKDLTVTEAALLAGLTNAPGAYDPVTYPDKAKSRMDWVLKKMYEEQFITKQQYEDGLNTQIADMLHVKDAVGGCGTAGSAAYFCQYVVGEIESSSIYGKTQAEREQVLLRGGLTITTTLDPAKQKAADDAVQAYVPTNDPSNVKAALVSVEPGTGKVLAMSQNTNYGDASANDANATQISYAADSAHGGLDSNGFQPGSAFKTFVLAQWYQLGKSGYASMNTSPTTFARSAWTIPCHPEMADSWKVSNANPSEGGTHNVIQNTSMSINVGYARMLTEMNVCDVSQLAADMGVTKADGSNLDPRPSIILGAQEVTPLAMANAYATFAAHGTYCKPIAITAIKDADGKDLKVPEAGCHSVMDSTAADKVALTLTNVLGKSGTAPAATLDNRPAAGKTGTTDKMDNAWFVGFTPQLAAAVWMGHSDGYYGMQGQYIGGRYYETMYGSDAPAPLWKTYMDAALAGQPVQDFNQVDLGASTASDSGTATDGATTGATAQSTDGLTQGNGKH